MTSEVQAPEGVIEFPELTRPQTACRLCQLARVNPNVLFVVHALYKRGLTGRPLYKKVEPVFKEANEAIPTRQSFLRHFANHLDDEDEEGDAPTSAADRTAIAASVEDYETDYRELRSIYNQFKEIFTTVRKEFTDRKKEDGKTSDYGLVMLVKLASELRAMLKTLSDMRNNDKFYHLVMTQLVDEYAGLLSDPLGAALRDVRDRLARGEAPGEVVERLDELLGGELFPLFESAATQAIERSKRAYKLH